jgi:hypothetical protein
MRYHAPAVVIRAQAILTPVRGLVQQKRSRIPAVRAFVDAIRSDRPSPVAGIEGHATLAAVLRAYGADAPT